MPFLVFAKEVQTFIRACEHLLSLPSSPPISGDEKAFVAYYIQELLAKYGAPKADGAASAEVGQGDPWVLTDIRPTGPERHE